ncbi:MAG: hypothetical protein U9P70_01925 [Patescibacteria group bacterium]|nr:hypothetical protein [Patescibacteria group bacterium]
MQDFFKSLFIKLEITKGSTVLSRLWSQRCLINIVRLYGELLREIMFYAYNFSTRLKNIKWNT